VITNACDGEVTFGEVDADLSPFATSLACKGPCGTRRVPAHGTLQASVSFRPDAAGAATARLSIDGDRDQTLAVELTGRGTTASGGGAAHFSAPAQVEGPAMGSKTITVTFQPGGDLAFLVTLEIESDGDPVASIVTGDGSF
jgi:hypothetical protein